MTEIIKVEGMSCEHCEKCVVAAVTAVPGVISASADAGNGTVRVETEDAGILGAVKAAIEDSGYDVIQ
jgi:copper chaperone CopZ